MLTYRLAPKHCVEEWTRYKNNPHEILEWLGIEEKDRPYEILCIHTGCKVFYGDWISKDFRHKTKEEIASEYGMML